MTNQYALGYKAGLEAAVKVCRNRTPTDADGYCSVAEAIAALPVPEVQWRDLTDDEIDNEFKEAGFEEYFGCAEKEHKVARAVIAKFKEKQLPTNYCQNSTKLVEKQCVDKLDMSPECVEKTAKFIHKAPRLHRAGSFGD